MQKSLHVIAQQQGTSPKGVTPTSNKNEYKSNCWAYLGDHPEQLVGGWIYIHEKSTMPSTMGGRVVSVETCVRDATITQGYAFTFTSSFQAKNVKWWESGNVRHGHGGFVDASLPHEGLLDA